MTTLGELFVGEDVRWAGAPRPDQIVTGLANDSRRVRPGDLFIALQGNSVDGRSFVDQALASGAVALLQRR
jgi:UDP-N-acetylmuramoyl-L-alanyl-D-glutamate--2,6-diaminopimelate ligase